MNNESGTVTVWQSGRLAPHLGARQFEFTRERWLIAALGVLSAIVLAAYVAVLQHEVDRSDLAHVAQRSRAVAEAQCEADQPAERRGACIALLNGDEVDTPAPVAAATPENALYEQENAARAMTVSLVSTLH